MIGWSRMYLEKDKLFLVNNYTIKKFLICAHLKFDFTPNANSLEIPSQLSPLPSSTNSIQLLFHPCVPPQVNGVEFSIYTVHKSGTKILVGEN